MPVHKTGGKGSRKIGRNEKKCKAYKLYGIREKNKRRRLIPHVERYPNDLVAMTALQVIGYR